MRNRILNLALVLLMALSLSGCAILYNDLKIPLPSLGITADTQARTSVGKASCASYVWVVSTGDCS
ncbi:MAG TPA: hypothetical protein PLU54_13210, partial [Deltaproteobacteria bacterium]|nr:hypothetical protein [Deltaproteobacteria bacterium]